MLHETLTKKLCSINPGEQRLAFSVFFYMNKNGEIIVNSQKYKTSFKKTIIKSSAKLNYDLV